MKSTPVVMLSDADTKSQSEESSYSFSEDDNQTRFSSKRLATQSKRFVVSIYDFINKVCRFYL